MKNTSTRIAPFAVAGALGLSALAAIPLMSSPAYAGDDLRAAFNALDANKDGVLTRDEFEGDILIETETATGSVKLEQSFVFETENLPADGDVEWKETLSDECNVFFEAGGAPNSILSEEFRRHDPNNDGKVSFDEFRTTFEANLKQAFTMLDRDNSNSLSLAEFSTDVMIETNESVSCNTSAGGTTAPSVEIVKTGPVVEFAAVSTDAAEKAETLFATLDNNNDKELSLDEFYGR